MADEPIIWLVVNSASGSNDPDAVARLRETLSPARVVDIQDETCPDPGALDAAGVGLLAVFAGDGTVGSVVTGLSGWDGDVLVLPGGTANLLARALHGERGAEEIVASLASLRRSRRSCIDWSGGLALIELLAGPGATWSEVREGMRDGDIVAIAASGTEAVVQSVAGPTVELAQPAIGREDGYTGIRLVPGPQGIGVSGYGAETFGDYLRQGVALLKRDYREGPHDELGIHVEVVCRSSDGEGIALMVDGEGREGASEERFSLAELPVNLLATQA